MRYTTVGRERGNPISGPRDWEWNGNGRYSHPHSVSGNELTCSSADWNWDTSPALSPVENGMGPLVIATAETGNMYSPVQSSSMQWR